MILNTRPNAVKPIGCDSRLHVYVGAQEKPERTRLSNAPVLWLLFFKIDLMKLWYVFHFNRSTTFFLSYSAFALPWLSSRLNWFCWHMDEHFPCQIWKCLIFQSKERGRGYLQFARTLMRATQSDQKICSIINESASLTLFTRNDFLKQFQIRENFDKPTAIFSALFHFIFV